VREAIQADEAVLESVAQLVGGDLVDEAMLELRVKPGDDDALFGLTAPERVAVWLYTSPYHFSYQLNAELRGEVRQGALSQNFGALLQRGVTKLPVYRGYAYRGLRLSESVADEIKHWTGVQLWPAFTSASRVQERAFEGNVAMRILSSKGRSLQSYAWSEDEQEILFLPNTSVVVTFNGERHSGLTRDSVALAVVEVDL
jgi:hypothetical protein